MKNSLLLLTSLIFLFCNCFEEPIWCDSVLYLTITNKKETSIRVDYKLNSANFEWLDSLTMIENQGQQRNEIYLKRRGYVIESKRICNDTISYKYYQGDRPCGKSQGMAEYLRSYMTITGSSSKYEVYPWSPNIFWESVCDGCQNANYDTINIE